MKRPSFSKNIILLEDSKSLREITKMLISSAFKGKKDIKIDAVSNPTELDQFLKEQSREKIKNLLIISDGDMYEDAPQKPKFSNNAKGTIEVLKSWKEQFSKEGVNFFLSFLTGNPENHFGYDTKFIEKNEEKNIIDSDNYQMNSTDISATPIIRKPAEIKTFQALMNRFDNMIRTTVPA